MLVANHVGVMEGWIVDGRGAVIDTIRFPDGVASQRAFEVCAVGTRHGDAVTYLEVRDGRRLIDGAVVFELREGVDRFEWERGGDDTNHIRLLGDGLRWERTYPNAATTDPLAALDPLYDAIDETMFDFYKWLAEFAFLWRPPA